MQSINDSKVQSNVYFNTRNSDGKRARLNAEGRELRLTEVREFLKLDNNPNLSIQVLDADPTKHVLFTGVILSNNFLMAQLCPKCLTSYNLTYDPNKVENNLKCVECGHLWTRKAHQGRPKGSGSRNNSDFTVLKTSTKLKADKEWIDNQEIAYDNITKHDFACQVYYKQTANFIDSIHNVEANDIEKLKRSIENAKYSPKMKEVLRLLANSLEIGEKYEGAKKKLEALEAEFKQLKLNAAQYEQMASQLQAIPNTPQNIIDELNAQADKAKGLAAEVAAKLEQAKAAIPQV